MLTEDRIDTEAETCDCDRCGRPIAVGERVTVDLAAGDVFCVRCADESVAGGDDFEEVRDIR